VVTAGGRLAADAPPLVLQPMERSIIRELRVKPGDAVKRGQVLAVLDPTFSAADRASLATQQHTLQAQLRRLEAEATGAPLPPATDRDMQLQAMLHAQRRSLHAARLRTLEEEIGGHDAALRALSAGDAVRAEQVAIAREVEALRERLFAGQIGSRLNWLAARAQRLQAEQDQQQARDRGEEMRHGLRAKQSERQGLLDDWQRALLEETVRLRAEASRVDEALAKALRLEALTVLTAPQDGIVLEVARRSAGSVLREAEPLVTLVPADVPLIAEIALRSADVGHARPGDAVVLKVDAFPYQRHGVLRGRLRAVGQDSSPPGGAPGEVGLGGAMHRAQVTLDPAGLPDGARLTPGMTVTAEIKVGTRSVLAYFLAPLLRGFEESIREP
jgi:hemolysin D